MNDPTDLYHQDAFTVLGASGFIGAAMVEYLRSEGYNVFAPERGDQKIFDRPLGHVIYAIGVTADFRVRPFDTMAAHVTAVTEILSQAEFKSLTYLSSTRVYGGANSGREDAHFDVDPASPDDLYNLSKLAGEAVCHAHPNQAVRIARLSNVIGLDPESANFVPTLLRSAINDKSIALRTGPASQKDYICIDDVVAALRRIALGGTHRIYNVAAGRNTSNRQITGTIADLTGCSVHYAEQADVISFPEIDTTRIIEAFEGTGTSWSPKSLSEQLELLVKLCRETPAAEVGG
jgi:nucleoside-diphosphate-sugar epimerase